jgi:pterin-4a-carbinolamine dehydratase
MGPYPRNPPPGLPDAMDEAVLESVLTRDLTHWRKVITPFPEDPNEERIEIFRECEFPSFQAAVRFMAQVAPGCDIAMHHPRWENIFSDASSLPDDRGHRPSDL